MSDSSGSQTDALGEETMSDTRSRTGILVGFAAAVGAFGAAAMMSAATAPTAHADDYTEIVANVDTLLGVGQNAFTAAETDFASSEIPAGLNSFINGVYDDTVGVSDTASLGTLQALTGHAIEGPSNFDFNFNTAPADFADAVTEAQNTFQLGEAYFNDAAISLFSGDFVDAFRVAEFGSIDAFDLPAQELFVGAVEALGL
jgi:hypothetical protein